LNENQLDITKNAWISSMGAHFKWNDNETYSW